MVFRFGFLLLLLIEVQNALIVFELKLEAEIWANIGFDFFNNSDGIFEG
jgi:hypothetical protein